MYGEYAQGSETHSAANEKQVRRAPTDAEFNPTRLRGMGFLLVAVFLGAILFLQWPLLKGLFYRASGIDAPISTIAWRNDFDSATAEARASDKPLLVVFSASWCPPCIVMKHDVWPDTQVSEAVKNGFVPLHIDVDDPRHADVAARYDIQGIPAVLIVDADGRVLRHKSFMSRSETLKFLDAKAS